MKIVAYYLPQFHCIPENDEWWGKGFTEWVNVKKAKPLFEGHEQPKVPLNGNYYNLLDIDVMKWQTEIAKEHGVYGFCFYHYWFDGKKLLEKPVENYLHDESIEYPYCICWANENWTNQWVSDNHHTLISQTYGDQEAWKEHFAYLLPFLKDKRYIKKDGKPLFVIYRPDLIPCLKEMLSSWNSLAKENGLNGICFACQRLDAMLDGLKSDYSMFDYCIEYQPGIAKKLKANKENSYKLLRKLKRQTVFFLEKYFHISLAGARQFSHQLSADVITYDYDAEWKDVIEQDPITDRSIPGAFVNWDNTPRKNTRGTAMVGVTPAKFEYYLSKQIRHAKETYKQDMIFMV